MKNSYILLRNNRESTALSIEQLQEIGLKKTDLIWVECQSMDWRSPFEIVELKNLISEDNNENKKYSTDELISQEVPNSAELLKKDGKGKTWTNTYIKYFAKYHHPDQLIISGVENKMIDLPASKSAFNAETNGMHLKNPVQRDERNKSTFAIHLPEQFKKIALYTGLMLTGALLMLLIMNIGSKKPAVVQQAKALPRKSTVPIAILSVVAKDTNTATGTNITESDLPAEKSLVTAVKERKRPVSAANNIFLKTNSTTETGDSSNANNENNAKPVMEIKIKPVTIEDVSSKITIEANDYNVGAFGGIRNLKITLQNGSAFVLNKVIVELKYLNPDGNIVKTKQLYFQNVQPKDAAILEVDKSKRGVKVEYHVTNIECKAITSSQSGLPDPGNYSTK